MDVTWSERGCHVRVIAGRQRGRRLRVPRGLRVRQHRVAIAVRVEHLPVDVRRAGARQEDDQRRDVVGIALGAHRLLARPLAGLLEHLAATRRGVDHPCGAARHDGVAGHAVFRHGVGRRPREPDDAGLGRRVVRLAGRAQRGDRGHADDAAALGLAHVDGGGAGALSRPRDRGEGPARNLMGATHPSRRPIPALLRVFAPDLPRGQPRPSPPD